MPCHTQITFKDSWKPSIDSLKECMISNVPEDLRCRFKMQIGIQNPFEHDPARAFKRFHGFKTLIRQNWRVTSPALHVWEPWSPRMGELAVSCDLPVQLVATRRILVSAASRLTTRLHASHKESPRNNKHNQRSTRWIYEKNLLIQNYFRSLKQA